MFARAPQHLLRFLPGAFKGWTDRSSVRRTRSFSEARFGALMITDLSGFTQLTAKLTADQGRLGIERTSRILNGFVALIIEIVEEAQGSILTFEGDALVAGWQCEPDEADMARATSRAAHCADLLRRRIEGRAIEDEHFGLRSAVSVGAIHLIHLLLAADDRRLVIAGPCMNEVSRCAVLAERSQVLISGSAWPHLGSRAAGVPLPAGCVELTSIEPPPGPADPPAPIHPPDLFELDPYLPAVLRTRPGWATSDWLAELRTVSTLFVRITAEGLPDDLDLAERAMRALHARVARYKGDVLRTASCEGGLLCLAAFGLPGRSNPDDPARSVLCALELDAAIRELGVDMSVAVATGSVFCGALGNDECAEYTVLGNSVNRAARLVVLAAGRILTDDATHGRAGERVSFQGPWRVQVPGLRAPVTAYVATGARADQHASTRPSFVDREAERRRLASWFDRTDRTVPGLVIEGDGGIGKSALVAFFVAACRHDGATVLVGSASDIEQGTPYFAFRRILQSIVGAAGPDDPTVQERLSGILSGTPEQLDFVPLLNGVADLGIPSNPVCEQMSNSARADNLRRLLRQLVTAFLSRSDGLLVIEDVHWLDSASEILIEEVLSSPSPCPVLMTTRGRAPGNARQVERIRLKPLGERATAELSQSLLQHTEVPQAVQDAIWHRAGGNPFFVCELCRALQQGPTSHATGTGSLLRESLDLPQSAQAAVLSRTDLLPPADLLVLKIASAMSGSFEIEDLAGLRVLEHVGPEIADCVARLAAVDLLRNEPEAADRYQFSHAITKDTVYASMVSNQRRDAHAAIAEALEGGPRAEDTEILPQILQQWQKAENTPKTLAYLDRVARLRLSQFDNESAIALIDDFIALASRVAPAPPTDRLAMAHFTRGEAALNLGRMGISRDAFETGLALLDHAVPQGGAGLALGLGREVVRHLVGSMRMRFARPEARPLGLVAIGPAAGPSAGGAMLLAAASAAEHLTQIHYFNGNKPRLIHATLCAANLAERVGRVSPALAVNYASLGAICGVIPLRRRADRYLALALSLSEGLRDQAVSVRVSLLTGLYQTSIGEWAGARSNFESGLAVTWKFGEKRRWCELAVSLETILNPGLLTTSYPGIGPWSELLDRICGTARDRGDFQVLACGLTSAVRGYGALGQAAEAAAYLPQLEELMRSHADALEPIHTLEAQAMLADAARRTDDGQAEAVWLAEVKRSIETLKPAMKSRTLGALSTAFAVANRTGTAGDAAEIKAVRHAIATLACAKLRQFAKAYPIGRPRAFLFRGDLEFRAGRPRQATALWRRALDEAVALDMCADALAASSRLAADDGAAAPSGLDPRVTAMIDRTALIPDVIRNAAMALGQIGNGAPHAQA